MAGTVWCSRVQLLGWCSSSSTDARGRMQIEVTEDLPPLGLVLVSALRPTEKLMWCLAEDSASKGEEHPWRALDGE